jgi:hypothetical protein
LEPKTALIEEAEKAGLTPEEFVTLEHGQSWTKEE